MIKRTTTTLLFFVLILGACGQEKKKEDKETETTSLSTLRDISVSEFVAMYNPEEHVLLDVRTSEEWDQGHLEKAVHIDFYNALFEDELKKLDKNMSYYIYCKSGGRSGKTLQKFKDMGFSEAYNIEGGITQLKIEGVTIIAD